MYLIDSNIFLESILKQKRVVECREFLEKVSKGESLCFISDFNLDSILIILWKKSGDPEIMEKFIFSILSYSGLSIYSATIEDRLRAIDHTKTFGLDFEDSLTLQTALSTGCSGIVSFDRHFDNLPVKRLEPKDLI